MSYLKNNFRSLVLDACMAIIAVMGIIGFWSTEQNGFMRIGIGALLLFSLWRLVRKDNAPALFLIGFIDATVLFRSTTGQMPYTLSNQVAAVLIFAIVLFLFAYRHARFRHHHFVTRLFSLYNSLLALLVGELFFVLTFFSIEAKNKAILLVLWLWFYDECIESLEENKLTPQTAMTSALLFALLFIGISLTFTFEMGL